MAINYGSNEVRSSGKIIGGDGQSAGRTLYFSGGNWGDTSRWYFDRDLTIPVNGVPGDEDTAVVLSNITSNSDSFIADTIIFENGNLDFNSYTISEVRHIVLKNSSELKGYGIIGSNTGTRVKIDLYDSSKLYFTSSITIYGDVNFHETSYIDTNSQSITIEGNVNVTSSGGNSSYQPIYGSSSYGVTILGDLRVVGNASNTTTIRYVKVFGKTELFQSVKIMDCAGTSYGFFGPVILTENCTIGDSVSFYNDVTLNEGSNIEGDTSVYFNAYNTVTAADYKNLTLTLNTDSYFSTNSYIYMYGGTLVLNTKGGISNGSSVTIQGDQYTTVEFRTNTGNGMSGTINCGTIKVFNDVNFGANSMPYLSSSIMKKIQFFNNSSLYSSLTVANECFVEFYDDSYITNSSTLTLGNNNTAIAKFYNRSYIDTGCTITNGSHVEMNDYTSNNGAISSDFAFFNGWSANEGTITGDASFSDRAENNNDITGNASFNDHSINSGDVTGDASFNGWSLHSGTVSGAAYYFSVNAHTGTAATDYYPAWA